MNHITSFFSKLTQSFQAKDELNNIVVEVITKTVGVELDAKNIKIFGDTIYIRENPIVKNEIFLKKTEVIQNIKNALGKKAPKNIR